MKSTTYIIDIKTPAQDHARDLKSEYGLDKQGLRNLHNEYWNLTTEALYEEAIFRGEGKIAKDGPLVVETGQWKMRTTDDKYIVREAESENNIWWGQYNRPYNPDKFDTLFHRMQGYLQQRDVFIQDCYAGAEVSHRLPIRIISELAWHSQFARNIFIRPKTKEELRKFVPEFTIINVPGFRAAPEIDGTRTSAFIILSFERKMCIIGQSEYSGEIKQAIFTLLNYLLPRDHILSMHCSANVGSDGDSTLFFGLSGTGKTALATDPNRQLIGDESLGWSDEGIFNLEEGCFAKVNSLSPEDEPQIYACTRMYGTILENVVFDPVTRQTDLNDASLTSNSRATYPINFIDNAYTDSTAGHPKNIVLLTCDAWGVIPPISKLTPEQAVYHFVSGYSSDINGISTDSDKEPAAIFSPCFGAPFMVCHPHDYADILYKKIQRYGINCWLVNTGWIGGPYGVGRRISIKDTRTILNAALSNKLDDMEYIKDPVFGFGIPLHCDSIQHKIMNPAEHWSDSKAYKKKYLQLATLFIGNFKKFSDSLPDEIAKAGPVKSDFEIKKVQ